MICHNCAITEHKDHLTECLLIDRSHLDGYIQKAVPELLEYRDGVQTLIDTCTQLSETNISVSSIELLSLAKIIQKILGVADRRGISSETKISKMVSILDILEKRKPEMKVTIIEPSIEFDQPSCI